MKKNLTPIVLAGLALCGLVWYFFFGGKATIDNLFAPPDSSGGGKDDNGDGAIDNTANVTSNANIVQHLKVWNLSNSAKRLSYEVGYNKQQIRGTNTWVAPAQGNTAWSGYNPISVARVGGAKVIITNGWAKPAYSNNAQFPSITILVIPGNIDEFNEELVQDNVLFGNSYLFDVPTTPGSPYYTWVRQNDVVIIKITPTA
ncbi:MAG: hypothetical protein ABL951_04160 [Alphaproteobacteria bacterium]